MTLGSVCFCSSRPNRPAIAPCRPASLQEKLQLLKQKEDDYSHGARLAVLKSNKLERDLKDARASSMFYALAFLLGY